MINCTYNVTRRWNNYPEPYEDIEGLGVLVGFLGTAWLMVVILIAYYLIFFEPELDPFSDAARRDCTEGPETSFRPNPIDSMLLGFLRRCSTRLLRRLGCFGKGGRSFGLSRLQRSMTKCILNFVDLQLIAGLGLLISGFLSLNQGLSAYHWLLVVYLAWLSNITHLSGLTALRGYFHSHQWERGWRLALMFFFMVLLLIALGPTAFFNRPRIDDREHTLFLTICEPRSPAICFFKPTESLKAYHKFKAKADQDHRNRTYTPFSRTSAFQSMIVSMILVVLNFFGRVMRIFPFVSKFLIKTLRRRARDLAKQALLKLSPTRRPFPRILNERQWLLIVVKPCLAMFLAMRFYLDIFVSAQSEIYWLIISGLWATLHLQSLKNAASRLRDDETSTTWTFGQTLPVLMLLGPAITAIGAFVGESEPANNPSAVDMEPLDISVGQNYQSSSPVGDPTSIRTTEGRSEGRFRNDAESTSFLPEPRVGASPVQVPMQLEIDPQSQEPGCLQRNYYETNWAPAICFWSCLQLLITGVWFVVFGTYHISSSLLTLIRMMWVWAFVAQPVTKFALILINLSGEEFRGARKWLNRPAVCHGLNFALYGFAACSYAISFFSLDISLGLDYRVTFTGLPVFALTCGTYVLLMMFYVVLMFFMAR